MAIETRVAQSPRPRPKLIHSRSAGEWAEGWAWGKGAGGGDAVVDGDGGTLCTITVGSILTGRRP